MKNKRIKKLLFIISCVFVICFASTATASAAYDYTLAKMEAQDSEGNVLSDIPAAGSFYLEVTAVKNTARDYKDMLIIAAYDAEGALIDFSYMRGSYNQNQEIIFGTLLKQNEKTIGSIKAFVWDTLAGMTPLSETFTYGDTAPDTQEATVILDNALFDTEECSLSDIIDLGASEFKNNAVLRYFNTVAAENSTQYMISPDAVFYVNEVEVAVNETNVNKYIVTNPVGEVKLTDTGEADGIYDAVYVEYYATARLSSISDSEIVLSGYEAGTLDSSSISLYTEAKPNLTYDIYLDGMEIAIDALQINDILSVKYDVTVGSSSSDFFEIYASRDVASGEFTTISNGKVVVGGKEFVPVTLDILSGMEFGNEYDLYLDSFGRIYSWEKILNVDNYAIVVGAFVDNNNCMVQLFLSDGTLATYEASTAAIYYNAIELCEMEDALRQVVGFVLNSDNQIAYMATLEAEGGIYSEFDAATGMVSGIKLASDAVIIDATEYQSVAEKENLTLSSYENFVPGNEYEVWVFGKKTSENAYMYAVITGMFGTV